MIEVQISKEIRGANLVLKVSVEKPDQVNSAYAELSKKFEEITKQSELLKVASVSQKNEWVDPMPAVNSSLSDNPILEKAPHSYSPREAILEVLDPNKSNWAKTPKKVSEIQDKLQQLGVRGISNINSFDKSMRDLHGQGKVRREKVDGKFTYYANNGA